MTYSNDLTQFPEIGFDAVEPTPEPANQTATSPHPTEPAAPELEEQLALPPVPAATGKPKPAPADAAGVSRRAQRRLIDHYDALRTADDPVRELLAVLFGVSGKRKTDPAELAIEAASTPHHKDGIDLLDEVRALPNDADRVFHLLALSDEHRSTLWKVLLAVNVLTGSPNPSNPTNTAKRLLDGVNLLTDEHDRLIGQARELRTPAVAK